MKQRLEMPVLTGVFALAWCASPLVMESSDGNAAESVDAGAELQEVEPTHEVETEPEISPAFESPWPSGFTRRELADTAVAKTYAFIEKRDPAASDDLLIMVSQDTVVDFHQELGAELAELTVETFADYFDEQVFLALGTDIDFLITELEERDRPSS